MNDSLLLSIISVVGARPQFIKYLPIAKAVERKGSNVIHNVLVHTGQHYDYNMSKIFFDELGIQSPQYHLEVGSGTHGFQTSSIINKMEAIFLKEKSDLAIVFGDTNSTLGAALAASKLHIPIAHVEAGLRSYNKNMPEEVNRILTDHISTFLFCPSGKAVENLKSEGFHVGGNVSCPDISHPLIVDSGDVMYDTLLYASPIIEKRTEIIKRLGLSKKTYCLLTIHRSENTDNPHKLNELIDFINDNCGDRCVLFPMHPRMKDYYKKAKSRFVGNVRIIDPIGYPDATILLKNALALFTDSGGMQKEAYWLKIPCITLRDETEWVETVASGWNVLYKDFDGTYNIPDIHPDFYGDGLAGEKILNTIMETYSK